MNKHTLTIADNDFKEVLDALDFNNESLDESVKELLLVCEKELKGCIHPVFIYRVFDYVDGNMVGSNFDLEGQTVKEHLEGCTKCACLCVTLGGDVDNLIRKKQITSMAEAMMVDKMASFLVEKACDKAEEIVLSNYDECNHTFRYGLGYGDFPVTKQKEFLDMLDADKAVGVHANEASLLIPTKSVTCIIGIK